ncbi:MarR family transcriptional regulator, partial [Streptococcus sobrinus]|uniref:MarR family transcriptional regulator n=1 Tax=Streptococcus sobrinus TaxID=1310 RepID=UPI0005167EB3
MCIRDRAKRMAKLTNGYSFAFQTLGYLCWKNRDFLEDETALLPAFDDYLQSYVYQKLWTEISPQDRKVLSALSGEKPTKVKALREQLGFSSSMMSVYRERLKRKGLIDVSHYGYLSPTLPRLNRYILDYEEL